VPDRTLDRIVLEDFLYREQLLELLHDLGVKEWPTNDVTVRRLLRHKFFDPRRALEYLSVDELRSLCRMRGHDERGHREELVSRVNELLLEERPQLKGTPAASPTGAVSEWWLLIHPAVRAPAESLFGSGHYSAAVFEAMKAVNVRVREFVRATTEQELDGADLMNHAFSPKSPLIRLADLANESGRNEQQGYMLIFAGAMQAIRNPKAHELFTIEERRAVHHLYLASLLMQKLDEAGVR
jgi:uncharacterized protein (TIGR02391 family)